MWNQIGLLPMALLSNLSRIFQPYVFHAMSRPPYRYGILWSTLTLRGVVKSQRESQIHGVERTLLVARLTSAPAYVAGVRHLSTRYEFHNTKPVTYATTAIRALFHESTYGRCRLSGTSLSAEFSRKMSNDVTSTRHRLRCPRASDTADETRSHRAHSTCIMQREQLLSANTRIIIRLLRKSHRIVLGAGHQAQQWPRRRQSPRLG